MWSQDFKEFVGLLNAHHAEYLVVGGYAVGAHGHPRYPGDLDVWIRPQQDNAQRPLRAIENFGFGSFGLKAEDFTRPGRVLQMGQPPFRIDVLTSIDGVEFGEAYPQRVTVDYEGMPVSFIGLYALKANKLANGRPKDLEDLRNLEPGESG
jgi:hypothetical protein